jgi:hypothetical protein
VEVWEAINNPVYRECSDPLTEADLVVINDAERALAAGLSLKRWWEAKEATSSYAEPFELVRTFNRAERVTGFFDSAPLGGGVLPVMGLVQEMLFDQPKQSPSAKVREELREFVLHYFLRVSSFRQPEAYLPRDQRRRASVRRALQPFSFCPDPVDTRGGFGYTQLYYKLRGSGVVGKFPRHLQSRIADLRRMDDIYEWIVLRVDIFSFNITFTPFADGAFSLNFPLREETYIAISRDFVTNRDDPTPGILGQYGVGYALLKPAPRPTIFAYGPGYFDAGFQLIDFDVDRRGQIRVRMVFVSNRPRQVLNLDVNPVSLGFAFADLMTLGLTSRLFGSVRAALERLSPRIPNLDPVTAYINVVNLLTGDLARDQLCASLATLERDPMLLTHFMEHYEMISGALATWRHVQSWLDRADIPEGVKEGTSF